MSAEARRTLRIDDPVTGEVCHVAHPDSDPDGSGRLRKVVLGEIYANPSQPRRGFDESALAGLADSIRARGVLQPIIIQSRDAGGYELIAGERRWRASELAGFSTIPALIVGPVDAAGSIELALIENIARENLSVVEEARTIAALLDEVGVTATALARRLGRSRSDLAHTVRLLELPDEALALIDASALSKGHGKALLTEPDHHRRRTLATRAADSGWSVRALEQEISRATARRQSTPPHPDQTAAAADLHDVLTRATGCDIRARPYRRGYQIILDQAAAGRLTALLRRDGS